MIFGKGERGCTFRTTKRAFFIKALKSRRFGNDIVKSVSVIFHGAFRWLFSYNQKPFVRRRLRRYRLRHKIHAIKTRPNNPLRYFNARTVSVAIWQTIKLVPLAKRRSEQENVFTTNNPRNHSINNTQKTKHNKQTRQTISPINRKINHGNNHNKQPTQSLNQKRSQNKHNIRSNNNTKIFEY